ncbi:hypothetical protein HS088_TW19G00251 [Tripterygium wilfordii]|uniref:Fiber protein Fb34 n=1 Tax=Tripterygium wilfordii TaxID=458696 RepID=A0A7J7C944_TRIWF|nr:hypothetical protein HS088_TW19G00251 [Tripterygium wilfordii]
MALTQLMVTFVLHVIASTLALVLASQEPRRIVISLTVIYDIWIPTVEVGIPVTKRIAGGKYKGKAKIVTDEDFNYCYCLYDPNISTVLGITAFSLLLASQVLTMKPIWCCCKPKTSSSNRSSACAIVLLIVSWLTFLIAEACLLFGSVVNAKRTKYRTIFVANDDLHCETLRRGVFEAGAAFVVLTSLASKFYHVCHIEPNEDLEADNNGEKNEKLGTYTMIQ